MMESSCKKCTSCLVGWTLTSTFWGRTLRLTHRHTDTKTHRHTDIHNQQLAHGMNASYHQQLTLVHPTSRWMHWATRWHHYALSFASTSASSQLVTISFRSRLTMSSQFLLGRPGFLLYLVSSHCIAWRGILESSIINTSQLPQSYFFNDKL